MINEIAERFKNYPDFFVTTFSQITVGDMEGLRKGFKKTSAVYMVVKNSMFKRAVEKSGKSTDLLDEINSYIAGSCGILFSKDDPAMIARSLVKYTKEHANMKIQGGFINGERISSDMIKLLATLPSRNALLAAVVSGMNAPISGFVSLLSNLLRNLIGVIDAINKKRGDNLPNEAI